MLDECSYHLDKIKTYLFQVKWIFIYSRTNKVYSGLNGSSSTLDKIKIYTSRLNESSSTPEKKNLSLG